MNDALTLPVELETSIKVLIHEAFDNAVQEIGQYEYAYIGNKMAAKMSVITHVSLPWVTRLACYYEKIFSVLGDNLPSPVTLSQEGVQAIGAALFYFINPYDIIPDTMPEIGYADDYYVFTLCINSLGMEDREVVCGILGEACLT